MALAGRLRSSVPLLQRILRSDSVSSQRATVQRSLLCPSFTNSEFSRNYATAAPPKEQKVKLPLTLFGAFGNYASALYLVAVKSNALDKVESEVVDFVEASKKSATFSQFMRDLSVPTDTRLKAIEEICAEAKFCDIVKNFLLVMAQDGRLQQIESVVKKFEDLTMAHRGEVTAIVTTVIPLPHEEEKELKETLQDIIGKKKVHLQQKIDPSILGGIVVEFDQKVIDVSIKARLKQMERFLREPIDFDLH